MTAAAEHRNRLRQAMRAQRRALSPQARMAAAEALAANLVQLPEINAAGTVAGYWAMNGELSLHVLLAMNPGFIYCLPCLAPGHQLRFAPWRVGDPLVQNRYGIPEPDLAPSSQLAPDDMDIVLLPLLAFDRHGARLGSGGGYYDRSFAFLKDRRADLSGAKQPLLIGVGYDFQEVDALAVAPWDIPLDRVVTDARTLDCR